MNDTFERLRSAAPIIALASGALALSSCANVRNELDGKTDIPPCFDTVIPTQPVFPVKKPGHPPASVNQAPNESIRAYERRFDDYLKRSHAWDKAETNYETRFTRILRLHVTDGIVDQSPNTPSQPVAEKTTQGLVEITAGDWKGTGFTLKRGDKQVVVTAAHVVGNTDASNITITAQNGAHIHPNGGCYANENGGKASDINDIKSEGVQDTDLAILTLPHPITNRSLTLAKTLPKPGNWVQFVNYQSHYGPNDSQFSGDLFKEPADYSGVVVPGIYNDPMLSVITGAQQMSDAPTNYEFDRIHMVSGGSGGPVVDSKGNVIGVSTQGTKQEILLDQESLESINRVKFSGVRIGEGSNFQPTYAGIVTLRYITKLLKSPRLDHVPKK